MKRKVFRIFLVISGGMREGLVFIMGNVIVMVKKVREGVLYRGSIR